MKIVRVGVTSRKAFVKHALTINDQLNNKAMNQIPLWVLQMIMIEIMRQVKRRYYPDFFLVCHEVAVMMNAARKTNFAKKLMQKLELIKVQSIETMMGNAYHVNLMLKEMSVQVIDAKVMGCFMKIISSIIIFEDEKENERAGLKDD